MKNSMKKWIKIKQYEVCENGYMKCLNTDGIYVLLESIIDISCNREAVKAFPAGLNHILMEQPEGTKDWYIFQAGGYNEINGLWHYMVNTDGTITKTM